MAKQAPRPKRKMGRPRKPEREKRYQHVVRLTPKEKRTWLAAAKAEGFATSSEHAKTFSAWIRQVVTRRANDVLARKRKKGGDVKRKAS